MHEFLRRGNFEPNLERVSGLLGARRDAMLEALERHLPDGASWSRPEGGYFIWLDLRRTDTGELLARAEEAGVTVREGHGLLRSGGSEASARCGSRSASCRRTEIAEGVARLAALLRGVPAPATSL